MAGVADVQRMNRNQSVLGAMKELQGDIEEPKEGDWQCDLFVFMMSVF